jgi:type 1 fimbria pilin
MELKINKVVIAASFAVVASLSAHADNTITFNGTVLDAACTVKVNGGTATIELGETPKGDLSAAGKTGAPKEFTVELSACPAAAAGVPTKAYVKFSGTIDGDPTYFKNSKSGATAATNVAVLLKDEAGTAIQNNDGNTAIDLPAAGGDITANYTASMVATATGVTKGDVSTTVTYNVSYE